MKFIRRIENEQVVVKIIPHKSVLNSQSRKIQSILHDLFIHQKKKYPWQHKNGWYIALRDTPGFWWIVRMYAKEQKKQIEFYCAMPREYLETFKTKFRNYSQWSQCTLQIVDNFTFADEKNTDLYKLQYKRHDMFSLDYDYTQQTSPIRDLMNITHDLKDGEAIDLFMRTESMNRGKWKKLSDYAWEQWEKGGVPHRVGFDLSRMIRNVYKLISTIFWEIKDLLDDTLRAFENSFFHKNGDTPKQKREKTPDPEREELLVNGSLSQKTKNKRNMPTFKTSIRYTVTSEDAIRRDMFGRAVANAFSDLNGDNYLVPMKVNIYAKRELNDLRNWKIKDLDPNIMSVDEVGKLQQLPTSDLQLEFKDELESNQRTEIEIPRVFLDSKGLLVGTASDKGQMYQVYIPTKNKDRLFTPRVINGSPRMGKDQHIINLIVEAKRKHGIGAVIPDFIDERTKDEKGHWRGMANAIRDHLPPEDVIDIDLSNTEYSFYLGLDYITSNVTDPRIAGDMISEYLTDFLLSEADENKFQTMTYTREAAKVTMGDLIGMRNMFMSQAYRQEKIKEFDEIFDMTVWRDFENMTDKYGAMSGRQGQLAAPVLRRISQLVDREFLKPMFCQTYNPKADLYKWIFDGKIVIIRITLPNGMPMPRAIKEILAYWIVLLTFLIKLSQNGKGAGTFLVLNEPHQFLSDGMIEFMKRMLSEGPKYRITPIIAFHDFSQFEDHKSFIDMLLASAVNWHLLKNTNEGVYKRLMPYLTKTFTDSQHAFESTKARQYIAVWLNQDAGYEAPFIVDALPMVGDRYETRDNSKLTEEHIKIYGRPTKEVLNEIKMRNRLAVG
jgi:hypothetical protein